MVPKDVHILTPPPCEYVTLHDREDFADVIKDKDLVLKWADYPRLSSGPHLITSPLKQGSPMPPRPPYR